MRIVFHERFLERYARDPAAEEGRLDTMLAVVRDGHELVEPEPATVEDLQRVHTARHVEEIRGYKRIYPVARLAAGGAIAASEIAMRGKPAFGLIRPPGHHASPDSCWGFCFFNNVAIAIKRLLATDAIGSALILDFDLHWGDGTESAFARDPRVTYSHPEAPDRAAFVRDVAADLAAAESFDVLAVSAGFDRFAEDWGGMLGLDDYREIGRLAREAAERACSGRRFAVLEGGYEHARLGDCLAAFLAGFGQASGPQSGDGPSGTP